MHASTSAPAHPLLRTGLLALLVLAGVWLRLLPPPEWLGIPGNFAPMLALALFGGCYLGGWSLRLGLPLLSVALSDAVLNYYYLGSVNPFYEGFYWQYGCYAAAALWGTRLTGRVNTVNVLGAGLGTGLLFYLVTNLGVWLGGGLYPFTGQGLLACYVAGLPFLKGTLLSNLVYGAVLFGGFEWLQQRYPALRSKPAAANHATVTA